MTRSVSSPRSCWFTVMTTLTRLSTSTFPFASLITPRRAGVSINRTALSSAAALYCSAASTWRNHSRVVSAANNTTTSVTSTLIRMPVLGSVTPASPASQTA